MARMIPNSLVDTGSEGERRVYESLSNLLPSSYTVFHSLRWIGSQRTRSQGEADFVIFHPSKGLMIIEVKSGIINLSERKWFQTNRKTNQTFEILDPEKQADESKFKLIEILNKPSWLICHSVWFPSIQFREKRLPPNYDSAMLFDSLDLKRPQEAIDRAFNYWKEQTNRSTSLSVHETSSLISILAPNFALVPSLESDFHFREQKFIQLTQEQTKILDFLELQPKAAIAGSAGTGKTLIAIEKARRLAANGSKVLFLCYNRLLASYLNERFSYHGFDIFTFDSLAVQMVGSHKTFEDNHTKFLNFLIDDSSYFPYTDIIIDEGQDFKNDWIEYLEFRIQDTSHFYVFYDQNQCIYSDGLSKWLVETPCRLTLTTNCRNTIAIAKTAYGSLGKRGKQPNLSGIEGDIVEVINTTESLTLAKYLNTLINGYVKEAKQNYSDIAILTMAGMQQSVLNNAKSHLHFPVSEILEKNSSITTTAKKFKGLEANIVVITDIEWEKLIDLNYRNLFYTTCARAKHQLFLISPPLNQLDYDTILSYAQDAQSKRKGKRRFFKLFNLREK